MEKFNEFSSKKHEFARQYAMIAHDDMGQRRKATGEPYHKHPQGVADLLEAYGASEICCIAAELHDTVEDTEVNIQMLEDIFGSEIAELISELTNSKDLDGLNKEEYMNKKLLNLSSDALTVKLADFIYNKKDRPRQNQLERMNKNIKFLIHHRKLNQIQKDLIEAFF